MVDTDDTKVPFAVVDKEDYDQQKQKKQTVKELIEQQTAFSDEEREELKKLIEKQ